VVKFLDLKKQYKFLKDEIDKSILSVIDDSSFIGGKYVINFENEFSEYLNINNCVGVANGTDALEIAIESFNFNKGREIIVPANSWISSSEAVTRNGLKVVFADINPKNYTLNIKSVEEKINSNTCAIMPVHLYGHPCDMNQILNLGKKYKIKIIEDCAQAHGAMFENKFVGTFGDISTFSFYPGKNLGAYGDAGAIVTNDQALAIKCKKIANHGRLSKFDHEFEGRNSRLDGIQASILSVKLKYLDKFTDLRNENALKYNDLLSNISSVILPVKSNNVKHSYHLFVIRVPKRDFVRTELKKHNIDTGIHYPISLPKLKAYSYLDCKIDQFIACKIESDLLSLPIHEMLLSSEIDFVCDKLKKIIDMDINGSRK
jgi:dTDP-4-amino-4,6-dideoxygalactose transaminase